MKREDRIIWRGTSFKLAQTIAAALEVRFRYHFDAVDPADVLVSLLGPGDLLCYSDELHDVIKEYARYLAGEQSAPPTETGTPIGRVLRDALVSSEKSSTLARQSYLVLRDFVLSAVVIEDDLKFRLHKSLNAIAERLATCDALELKAREGK